MTRKSHLSSLFVFSICLIGCNSSAPSAGTVGSPTPTVNSSVPETKELHIALAPSEDAEKMANAFEAIRIQLAKDTGLDVHVDKVTDYASVIEAQKAGKVDIAWYGPLSMVLANQEAGVKPIVLGVTAGGDATYHSLILVPANSPAKSILDLKGKKIAFVDPGSASGNLVPRGEVMKETQKKAEDFFGTVTYAGSHDASLLTLQNGNVDACAVQDITYDEKVKSKELDPTKVKILWKSDPLPQSPLAIRKDMDPTLATKIVDSFLSMDKKGVKMDIPGNGNFAKFIKVDFSLYKPIADMAKALGLSKQEMVK